MRFKPEKPQRAEFDRYNWSWCNRCGAAGFVEKPKGLVITHNNLDQAVIHQRTCECNAGAGGENPNPVFAAKQPDGWFIRKLAGLDTL